MIKLILYLNLLITFVSGANVYSQDFEEDENETSETILQREQFINERRAGGPGKVLPKLAHEKAVLQKMKIPEDKNTNSITSTTSWVSVNPEGMWYEVTDDNYISGRTNGIAFHPSNPNIIYIAAAQGGVWKTIDGGISWTALTDNLGSISSGDIAIDPSNPNVLYYGTGELNYSGDSQYGDGVYKSTDAGLSWNKIVSASLVGAYIGKIVVDPVNSNNVYIAGREGIFKTTNGGVNFTNVLFINSSALVMSPVNPSVLYCANGSNQTTIYKTTNGGLNWNLSYSNSSGRRTQIAISPDNENYIYASIAASSGALLGVYRTTNGGDNWTLQSSSPNYMSSQGWYDNAVTVIPGNPNGVIVGGLDVYSSTNGGVTLAKKSAWATSDPLQFSHADIHYLTYNGNVLYCCSDGGVYRSTNNGNSWSDLNAKISTLQFQSADYDPTDVQKLYGGCQDNNKQTSTNSGLVWIQRTTGDGGYTVVDPVNTNYIYGQYVNGSIQRSQNFGVSFTNITPSGSSGGLFYNPYEMAPGDHNTVVFGRANVYKTTSVQTASTSQGWTQIAATGTIGGNISAIGISFTNINKIYIGTSGGKLLVTTDNGANWSSQTGFGYVTDLVVDFANDDICYASLGGATPDKHVYKTTNGGVNWFSISGNLPDIGHNSIALRQTSPRMIFVGTDLGVFKSTNEGANWVSFNSGFPNVEVYDMKYKEGPQILLAATHGRGCFTFDVGSTVGISGSNNIPGKFHLSQNYPNPFNPVTRIKYELESPGFVTLKVYNALGSEVANLVDKRQSAGKYEISFDGKSLPSGVYFYRISSGEFSEVKSMMLIK